MCIRDRYALGYFLPSSSIMYSLLLMFFIVAPAEEGCKYYFLNKRTWNHRAFNYQFDGVVYAVFVSLGFAALENIGYVLQFGFSVALTRALVSVPAHMCFAVFMGSFYGRAKVCSVHQDQRGAKRTKRIGLLVAIILHGFYNSCLLISSTSSLLAFSAFVVFMYIIVIRKIKMDAKSD